MNFKEIKNEVINKRWSDEDGRYGDDYRSLSKQIDNFINHLKKADSPLHWLPLDSMTDQEVADLIDTYIDRSEENRLLLNNLSRKSLKYNYSDLIVENPKHKHEMEMILETFPELRNYNKLKIKELIEYINIDLVGASCTGYMKAVKQLLGYIDDILYEIMDEENLFKCIGLNFRNTDYIEQYIMVCERIVYGSLFYFLVCNDNIPDKHSSLIQFEKMISKAEETMDNEVSVAKEHFIRERNFHKEYHKAEPREMDEISLYYVQFLERQAYYQELDSIGSRLLEEIENELSFFEKPTLCVHEKVEDYDDKELEAYLCEGINVPDYESKLEQAKKIIDFAFKSGSHWVSSKNALDLKITFRELFMSKQDYQRQTAITMVRNILAGDSPTRQQLMFLDAKIIRGYFRENNMMPEYQIYERICKTTRNTFLKAYSAINDDEAYQLIHRTCFEFLYLFGDSGYSGIRME